MVFESIKADRGGVVLDTNNGLINTGTINGDLYIVGAQQYHLINPKPLFRQPRQNQPLSLLSSAALAPLIGRGDLFTELLSWCLETGGGIRGALLYGGGGLGKSRLAHELSHNLSEKHGWVAGRLTFREDGVYSCGEKGSLWVIDYAEEQLENVKRLLERLAESEDGHTPHRLLLLSRNGPDFWQDILDAHAGDLFGHSYQLGPLEHEGDDYKLFTVALSEAAAHLGKDEPRGIDGKGFEQWQQRHDTHKRPLFILAYALNLVEEQEAMGLEGVQIIEALNRRERRRLVRLGESSNQINGYTMERLLFISAINNGLNAEELRRLAAQPELELGLPSVEQIVDSLRKLGVLSGGQLPPSP